jgi:hypothetical protein
MDHTIYDHMSYGQSQSDGQKQKQRLLGKQLPAGNTKYAGRCSTQCGVWRVARGGGGGGGGGWRLAVGHRVAVWPVARAVRAVQSLATLPVFRRQAPRWARGWVGDPRARSRTPPTSAPFAKKVGSKT